MSRGSRTARAVGRSGFSIVWRSLTLWSITAIFGRGIFGSRFDTIVFASQGTAAILHGYRAGENASRRNSPTGESPAPQRPEFTGGIGIAGAAALDEFVRQGGRLVAMDEATDLPVNLFGLPVRPIVLEREDTSPNGYYCPGSILRLNVGSSEDIRFLQRRSGMGSNAAALGK